MSKRWAATTPERIEFLQRTRPLSIAATVLAGMWLFGNLYEEIVLSPGLISAPLPGALVGPFEAGSPVYYYLPWAPLCLVLTVVLRVRHGGAAPDGVRRAWNGAIGAFVAALAVKLLLIVLVNPAFRDPVLPVRVVRDHAVLWAIGNGATVLGVGLAVLLLTKYRAVR